MYKRQHQETNVEVEMPEEKENYSKKIAAPKVAEAVAANDMKAAWMTELADLNVCSQKGLVEMFDGSILSLIHICISGIFKALCLVLEVF